MGQKIQDGTNSIPPTITWVAYILRNDEWSKLTPTAIPDESAFCSWMDALFTTRARKGGILMTMENLQKKLDRAHKDDLLSRNILKEKSRQSALSQSHAPDSCLEEENSSCEEYEDLELYVDQIYNKYLINTEFDLLLPSYPNPVDPEKYILLLNANVDIWAKALVHTNSPVHLK
ncbi:hypothetical protein PtA15_11A167 [Puccinia triticina]|uniref:Uncharacterized protein n=1 Tax=Puccinia triticina TaxID=208348 RepID=A0ABY7CX22_9BASI|nr:uncharacterized protein PtA15_11A167 [Puccinia triticina]WAQ89478.1 hypothetical protein PtA15_11A167 [Puccinia triticina]